MKPTLSMNSNHVMVRELKDYLMIALGMIFYGIGWTVFLLPNDLPSGAVPGIASIVYWGTGLPVQYTYFAINALLLLLSLKILGWKFSMKTVYAVFVLTFFLSVIQRLTSGLQLLHDQPFMACILGAIFCGSGIGFAFTANGSTGGTDIIAAIIHKYKDVTLGRMIMACDFIIISSCYVVFHDWRRVIFGFVTLFVIGFVLDYIVNSARQSVQFFIFSKEYEKIADRITKETHRGVTVLDGIGWYSKHNVKVLVVLAYKRQSVEIFRMVKDIDPNAFISQSSVIGVYGEGFDRLKVK